MFLLFDFSMLVGHRVSLSLILVGVVCSSAFISLEKKIQSDLRLKKLKELDHQQKYKESSGATSEAHTNDVNMILRRTDVGSYDQREQKHMMPFRRQWLPSTESIFRRRQQESHNGMHAIYILILPQ